MCYDSAVTSQADFSTCSWNAVSVTAAGMLLHRRTPTYRTDNTFKG
jgi:hypothetical protein